MKRILDILIFLAFLSSLMLESGLFFSISKHSEQISMDGFSDLISPNQIHIKINSEFSGCSPIGSHFSHCNHTTEVVVGFSFFSFISLDHLGNNYKVLLDQEYIRLPKIPPRTA